MKNPLLVSRLLQFSIVLSFLLPFFFVGCENSLEESRSMTDSMTVDTVSTELSDTLSKQNTSLDSLSNNSTQTATNDTLDKDDFSKELIAEHEWLRPILIPSSEVYTGMGLIINLLKRSIFFNIFFAFLLITIGLVLKFLETSAIRTQILHNVLAIVFLFIYIPNLFSGKRLWGFWLCLLLIFLTLALDIYRLILNRSKKLY